MAAVGGQNPCRNLAWTNAKIKFVGSGSETAKHHLNPSPKRPKVKVKKTASRHLWNPLQRASQKKVKKTASPQCGDEVQRFRRRRMRNGQTPAKSKLGQAKKTSKKLLHVTFRTSYKEKRYLYLWNLYRNTIRR